MFEAKTFSQRSWWTFHHLTQGQGTSTSQPYGIASGGAYCWGSGVCKNHQQSDNNCAWLVHGRTQIRVNWTLWGKTESETLEKKNTHTHKKNKEHPGKLTWNPKNGRFGKLCSFSMGVKNKKLWASAFKRVTCFGLRTSVFFSACGASLHPGCGVAHGRAVDVAMWDSWIPKKMYQKTNA